MRKSANPVFKVLLLSVALMLFALPAFAQEATPEATPDATPEAMSAATDAPTIAVGDTVNGTLTDEQPAMTYTLEADAGEAVTISLSSTSFDTYLSLLDADGNLLASNDDSNGTDSAISSYVLPEGATYQVLVESYSQHNDSGSETGDFTLSVVVQQVERIEYSQTVDDSLTSTELSKDFLFSGQSGDVIIINLSSADFDAYLHLFDSDGNEIASNDDSATGRDSQIGPFSLPATGTYTISADSFSGDTTGDFTLSLSKVELSSIEYGTPTDVEFSRSGQVKYFTFDGTYGDIITISVDSNDSIDTSLVLTDPYSSQVASDDDSGPGADPEIYQQLLTDDGTYTIALSAVSGDKGELTLTVERVPPPSLDDGAQTVSFSDSQYTRALAFTATAGETVKLTVSTGGETVQPNIYVLQEGNTIANASISNSVGMTFSFVTPTSGEVIVEINDYSYDPVSYTILLERQGDE